MNFCPTECGAHCHAASRTVKGLPSWGRHDRIVDLSVAFILLGLASVHDHGLLILYAATISDLDRSRGNMVVNDHTVVVRGIIYSLVLNLVLGDSLIAVGEVLALPVAVATYQLV